MKILLIEDNSRLSERIKYRLGKDFLIDLEENGENALEQFKNVDYSVIVLDLGLPDMPGLEVCRRIRTIDKNIPILVLTGVNTTPSRVELLSAGADDYMSKPFEAAELIARIKALARRASRPARAPLVTYRDIVINTDSHQVKRGGVEIDLRRKEFDILAYLIANSGRILTREMIMAHAWDANSTSWTSTVDVHIKHLRDKIDKPFKTKYIKTAYGLGYKVDATD